MVIKG
ncbi:hypothetical protein VCHC50A1_2124, partial [Vibrio cholerae HC-50A1]